MQIELIGCTSAGKSTLAEGILQACSTRGIDASLGNDYVLKQARLNWVRSYLVRTFVLDLLSLFGCLVSCRNNFRLYLLIIRIIWHLPGTVPLFEKLNIARNALKKIGIYEITRRRTYNQQIVLLDEGTLHIAHNLFVHVSAEPNKSDLLEFIGLVPLPDIAIYVRQDEVVLIKRNLKRGHKRIPSGSSANVERFVKRAVDVFETLGRQPALEGRLLVMDRHREITIPQDCRRAPPLATALKIILAGIDAVNIGIVHEREGGACG